MNRNTIGDLSLENVKDIEYNLFNEFNELCFIFYEKNKIYTNFHSEVYDLKITVCIHGKRVIKDYYLKLIEKEDNSTQEIYQRIRDIVISTINDARILIAERERKIYLGYRMERPTLFEKMKNTGKRVEENSYE